LRKEVHVKLQFDELPDRKSGECRFGFQRDREMPIRTSPNGMETRDSLYRGFARSINVFESLETRVMDQKTRIIHRMFVPYDFLKEKSEKRLEAGDTSGIREGRKLTR